METHMRKNGGLREFVMAFRPHWFAAMSGGFSVPFMAATVYLDNTFAKAVFGCLAFSAAWYAAYRVWLTEREKANSLQSALDKIQARPSLHPAFDMNDPTCVHRNLVLREVTSTNNVIQRRCDWYRIRVDARGGSISGCQARLMSVKRAQSELIAGDYPPLEIVHADGNPKTIHEGVSDHVDLLYILENDTAQLCVPLNRRSLSVDWNNMFSLAGEYEITVDITSPEAQTVSYRVIFRWNLNRATAQIVRAPH